jgi:hypothetical protein
MVVATEGASVKITTLSLASAICSLRAAAAPNNTSVSENFLLPFPWDGELAYFCEDIHENVRCVFPVTILPFA